MDKKVLLESSSKSSGFTRVLMIESLYEYQKDTGSLTDDQVKIIEEAIGNTLGNIMGGVSNVASTAANAVSNVVQNTKNAYSAGVDQVTKQREEKQRQANMDQAAKTVDGLETSWKKLGLNLPPEGKDYLAKLIAHTFQPAATPAANTSGTQMAIA